MYKTYFKVFLPFLFSIFTIYPCFAETSSDDHREKTVVRLFSADWCPYCKKAIDYLNTLGIEYEICDIDTPEGQAKYDALGAPGIPIFTIGQTRVDGFNEKRLNSVLCATGVLEHNTTLCS